MPQLPVLPQVLPSAEEAAALYRELSQNPAISAACLGPDVTTQYGGKYCSLYTEWSQRDLVQAKSIKFCRQYLLFHDGASIVYAGPGGACCEINNELLSRESPSGALKAVLLKVAGKEKEKEKEKQFLEVWYQNRKVKSIDLTALDKHGSVYDDDQFGCLAWSHSETHLLYVAEKKRPKAESFFQTKAPELDCSADEELECPKKPDAPVKGEQFVYHEDWGETLSTRSVPVLCVLDIEGSSISVLEGVPKHVSPGQAFWSPDDTGVVFVGWWHEPFHLGLRHCTNRRSALFYVDLTGGKCELLSEDTGALWSPRLSPDRCHIAYLENRALGPHQQCSRLCMQVAVLPGVGQEAQIKWICLQNAPPVPGISWGIRTLKPPPEQENPQYEGLDFDAILLRPSEGPTAQKPPLVVMPHVNYRGSLGFGQDSVNSLPGNVGMQDVRDVQFCVERVLQEEQLDASRVALVGGSHGGFLACHLIGQFPGTYRACVVRNPVVNIASMLTITDIPDWCLTEMGARYEPDALPDPAHLTVMLQKSPMSYINQVRTPVLLMLGEDDRRVPPAQGLEYYRALKARGVPTRLLWYPKNNHALAGIEAEADGFMNIVLWLLQHLQG
ncbi:hypothetical protein CIB84_014100 [Bambusicola thoracicus]|uniref:Acylamino-acid-releasing enzyme n=1 Tax=Bambusicola thoracicus TaxID=9083 RepID=A0A2P4SDG0_BAMTH|nr:hypothetical protein CIB84_014100 [Bambusicola thoracicus]